MEQDVAADVAAVQDISAITSILKVVLQTTGMGFAAVARVTETQWVACQVLDPVGFGLKAGDELPIKTTLCDEVRSSREEIVIDEVAADPAYADHHTPQIYGLQSYISVPIFLEDDSFFGTLCAIDPRPTQLRDSTALEMCRLFATLIGRQIDGQHNRARLAESLETAQLREQFIAVLGHDLRNPISALQAGTHLLGRQPQNSASQSILAAMGETVERMTALVEDLLDLARGRVGGGIQVDARTPRPLGPALEQVVSESRLAHPERDFEVALDLDRDVPVDPGRMAQLFANLVANAVRHGAADEPIRIAAGVSNGQLAISVANGGAPIPADLQARLFQPFFRGDGTKGLGLGLYIASEIARGHGGALSVASDDNATIFTFAMLTDD